MRIKDAEVAEARELHMPLYPVYCARRNTLVAAFVNPEDAERFAKTEGGRMLGWAQP